MALNSDVMRFKAETPRDRSWHALLSFAMLCTAMFVNLILAFLHARGLPSSSGIVVAVQASVTAFAVPAMFWPRVVFKGLAFGALGLIVFLTLVTNILNPFNIKSIYDTLLIPIYIALGMSALYVRPKWMNYLLLFVIAIVLIEVLFPTVYVNLFDPAGYFSSTREWVAGQKASAASKDGFYTGSYRAGGSQFAFTDHRIGGPFLEPLSLGYFAFIMSTYYAGLYRGSALLRIIAILACVSLALASDSRVPTALILLSTFFLILRPRLPIIVLWLTFPVVVLTFALVYYTPSEVFYGDTYYRLGITFDALQTVNIGQIMVGMVPLERAGDSGILYMLRCVGLFGAPVAIWFYCGAYVYRSGTNVAFLVVIAVYLTITLMFGGAALSIKTASLVGYLVGLAIYSGRQSDLDSASTQVSGIPVDSNRATRENGSIDVHERNFG